MALQPILDKAVDLSVCLDLFFILCVYAWFVCMYMS